MPRKQKSTVRIANAGGYWGDDPDALDRALKLDHVDYVVIDHLSEITMVLLERARRRDPNAGYALDLIPQLRRSLRDLKEKGAKLVVNGGGVNPEGCRDAILALCEEAKVPLRVATVSGDNVRDRLSDLRRAGASLSHLDSRAAFDEIADRVVSAHVYLGARPIAMALEQGADVVVTGRVTDAALTVGPLIYEFGWAEDDWDRLTAGTVAGHLLECSGQATGATYTDWEELPTLVGMGYPLVDVEEDGTFVVSKPPGSGGVVNRKTITEQLLYEIGNPKRYLTPDVTADLTSVELEELGNDRVRVKGARGTAAPNTLKVGVVYSSGFRASGTVLLSGPNVLKKGRALAELIWAAVGTDVEERRTDFLGHSACWGGAAPAVEPNEMLLRLAVWDRDRKKVGRFSSMFLTPLLKGPPGLGVYGGRPKVEEALEFWPALVPAQEVPARIEVIGAGREPYVAQYQPKSFAGSEEPPPSPIRSEASGAARSGATRRVRLRDVAYGRSGDKGDICNIGIAARSPEVYQWLRESLTPAVVKNYYSDLILGEVQRFELPNLLAFNFVCQRALGGGGTRSLRVDHQGKTVAQGLLNMEVDIDPALLSSVVR